MIEEQTQPGAALLEAVSLPLPFAYGGPSGSGLLRSRPEDFRVDEISPIEPSGEGEHRLLLVQKRNSNTDWVAGQLARHAGVPRRDVGYAGLKDRYAVTRQWFTVGLAGRDDPDWQALNGDELQILEVHRHNRKLKSGALSGNRFRLLLRDYAGDVARLGDQLKQLEQQGMPNYFGEQRFGREGSNLEAARSLFSGTGRRPKRQQLGFYLSAARSALFNHCLAARVGDGSWLQPLPGERLMLAGSRSSFLAEEIDDELLERHRDQDIHISAPLWGRGEVMSSGAVAELEQALLGPHRFWCEGLERHGLKMERRAVRAIPAGLEWEAGDGTLELAFELPRGCFATTLLRELVDYRTARPDS